MFEILSEDFKEKIMKEYCNGYNKEKIESVIDDFIDQHVKFNKGKKTSLERLVLPGWGDLYLRLDETMR